jgi:hypothetical protein
MTKKTVATLKKQDAGGASLLAVFIRSIFTAPYRN